MDFSLERGRLDTTPAAALLATAQLSRLTGRLVFQKERAVKEIYFAQGVVTGATSNQLSESFGKLLLKWGLINQETYEASLAQLKGGERHGEILSRMGMLDPACIPDALRSQHLTRITDAVAWTEGTYRFKRYPAPTTGEFFSLWPILQAGILRGHGHTGLENLAKRLREATIRRTPGYLEPLVASFPEGLSILGRLKVQQTVAQAMEGAKYPIRFFTQLLVLKEIGLLRFETRTGERQAPEANHVRAQAHRAWQTFKQSPQNTDIRRSALEAILSALTGEPGDADLATYAGMLLRLEGRFNEAESMLRKALALRADHPLAHEHLQSVLRRKGSETGWAQVHTRDLEIDAPITLQRRIGGVSRVVNFKKTEIRIGSAEHDDLLISTAAVPTICKSHCTVLTRDNQTFVRRNGNSGRVWVDDREIDIRKEIAIGSDDTVRLVERAKGAMFDFRVLDLAFIRQIRCSQDGISWIG